MMQSITAGHFRERELGRAFLNPGLEDKNVVCWEIGEQQVQEPHGQKGWHVGRMEVVCFRVSGSS